MAKADSLPISTFKDKKSWTAWLNKHHRSSAGVWVRFAKKGSLLQTLTYADALETALCYGWIDDQKQPENKESWLQRFGPRTASSLWSKINREKALELISAGTMEPAGLEAIEVAKKSGRWEAAYDSPSASSIPDDFQAALEVSPKAKAFFDTLNRANRYAVLWRIQTVKKAETRARKIVQFVAMLEENKKLH